MLDTIVIGGGFAGLVAARELGRRGYDVALLEARERLGGRTWLAPFGGTQVEMGGAFVHRTQPHVWAELTRYGLGVVELPDAETSFLRTDDGVRQPVDQLDHAETSWRPARGTASPVAFRPSSTASTNGRRLARQRHCSPSSRLPQTSPQVRPR